MRDIVRLYHLTDRSRIASIAQYGLDPSRSREPDFRERSCYLSADRSHAEGYLDHHGDWEGEGVLLAVDVASLDPAMLAPDDVDLPDVLGDERELEDVDWRESLVLSGQCRYLGIVPASAVSALDPETGVMVPLLGGAGPRLGGR